MNSVIWEFNTVPLVPRKPAPPGDLLGAWFPGYRSSLCWASSLQGLCVNRNWIAGSLSCPKATLSHTRTYTQTRRPPHPRIPYYKVTFFSLCQFVSVQILNIGLGIKTEYIHTFLENLQTKYSTFMFALLLLVLIAENKIISVESTLYLQEN